MLNRTTAPPFSKTFSFDLPHSEIIPVSGGINLVFLPGIQQDIFKLEFIFDSGKWWEPKKGVSHFTATMLDKGTSGKSAKDIAEAFDFYGAQIEISPGYDFVSVSLYGLKKHFEKIFSLFWEILTEPSFPQEELELQKEIFIQNLKVNNEKNNFVASKILRRNIFGDNHPYGNSVEENDAANVTRDDLANYFKRNFLPHEIYLIGNFSQLEIQALVKKLKFSRQSISKLDFNTSPGSTDDVVTKTDSVQSSLRIGRRVINRTHPDYFELLLLNHILGGYFGSRLMKNIREEKGLTYGIYSSINPFKEDCLFSIGADVGKEKRDLAITEIKRELNRLIQDLISYEELTTAKNHFLGSLQLEVANPFSCLDKIKSTRLNGLGGDYYNRLLSVINSSNVNTLQSIAVKYLTPSDMHVVAVG
jgi:predicted Zn-dependent peptidase